ncbi:DinB family protein [Tenacibaculum sp. S7007]|uniref:DinB family protein n=1 Tax=Tenacibaculum pelagium TaxID=2759527 RepID=A0A839ARJ9_9FLAO|nr:DinB family protein [Tenacibaculum pelagium]MBA6157116.1 DinB family protein [Tenacibaculum pelagium]
MKNNSYTFLKPLIIIFLLKVFISNAQNIIESPKGYSPQIGTTVSMLEDLKKRVTNSVINLTDEETDFLLDKDANRIGAMILHLAATEKYYQLYTFENRGFNKDEKLWETALNLGKKGREELKGKPIKYYLKIWDKVRKETLRLLKTKDDKWFKSMVGRGSMNNYWAWYHVMEHQANHMGQIRLIIKRAK